MTCRPQRRCTVSLNASARAVWGDLVHQPSWRHSDLPYQRIDAWT